MDGKCLAALPVGTGYANGPRGLRNKAAERFGTAAAGPVGPVCDEHLASPAPWLTGVTGLAGAKEAVTL